MIEPRLETEVRNLLVQYFSLEELKTLCIDLGVEFENIKNHDTRELLARGLIEQQKRTSADLDNLIELGSKHRPSVQWPSTRSSEVDRAADEVRDLKLGLSNLPKYIYALILILVVIISLLLYTLKLNQLSIFDLASKLTDSSTLVPLSSSCVSESSDESQISCLIGQEAEAALYGNVDIALSIFSTDALIRDAQSGQWRGLEAIRKRYEELLSGIVFYSLQHDIIELDVTEDEATATTTLRAEYGFRQGYYPEGVDVVMSILQDLKLDEQEREEILRQTIQQEQRPGEFSPNTKKITIFIEAEERWTFIKQEGEWKVKTLIGRHPSITDVRGIE